MTMLNDGHQNGRENYPGERQKRAYGPRDWPASEDVVALEEADSHFTPPRPPGISRGFGDPVKFWATVGALLGPIGAVVALVFRAAMGNSTVITGLLWFLSTLFVGSLITLLLKMPHKTGGNMPDDDDGAVV